LGRVLPAIGDLWQNEWLPSILPGLERARTLNYADLTDQELAAVFDELHSDFIDRYTVHGKINFVAVSASEFADFYNAKLQPADPTEPYHTLQGFPTRSLDAGRGLWRLSRIVKADTKLRPLFESLPPQQLMARLEQSEAGRAFLAELRTYLDEFGWRADAFELAEPTWRENPRIPLNTIQGYLGLGDAADPDVKYGESIAQRERLLAAARERLAESPADLAAFNGLYDAARWYLTITEDHNYYIDQVGNSVMRLPALELGRRLVHLGSVESVDDVFLLYRAEIGEGLDGKSHRLLVKQRRAEMQQFAQIVPPPFLGLPPPQDGPPDPFAAAMMKMFGMPPEPSTDASIVAGIPASRGTVQGRAKVVRTLAEASKVEPGDILVCEMTMPPWTPLFSTVAAIVADTGGVLSHCAIVAREYGLPCVVGTTVGTSVLRDGMLLTVDGSKGIVRIDSRD
jgi:rifampicin phosphotransferase